MAQKKDSPEATLISAKYQIFNKLCMAYRRSYTNPAFGIRADDVRGELKISESIFAEALDSFKHTEQTAVELFESNGKTFLRLGESARYHWSDWPVNQKRGSAFMTETPMPVPSRKIIPHST